MDQQMLQEAAALQQYTSQLEEQHEFLMRQIAELEQFLSYLPSFQSSDKEMYANVGKGVYVKSEKKSQNFLVEVGSGVLVEKSPEELKQVIENQTKQLKQTHIGLANEIGFYGQKLQDIMAELERQEKQESAQ